MSSDEKKGLSKKAWGLVFVASALISVLFLGKTYFPRDDYSESDISAIKQAIKTVGHAIPEFVKLYKYYPGDLPNPEDVLPGCAKMVCYGGDGNSMIGYPLGRSNELVTSGENQFFWEQLEASGLIGKGVHENLGYGSRLYVFYYDGTRPLPYSYEGTKATKGHYLVLLPNSTTNINDRSMFLTAENAAIIDLLDDHVPTSGGILAAGKSDCIYMNPNTGGIVYNYPVSNEMAKSQNHKTPCAFLYIKFLK